MQFMVASLVPVATSVMRKRLALVWLILGFGIAISSVIDLGESHWRISWLLVGVAGTVLAWTCSAVLILGHGRWSLAGIVIATLFVLYCAYLFTISPPDAIGWYSILGSAVILLGVATVGTLMWSKAKSEEAAA